MYVANTYPSVTAIRRTVAPATSVLSMEDAKEHLRVHGSDEDYYIRGLIAAAEALVDGEGLLGRAMITQTWAQWVNQAPGWVRLSMSPFQSLVSVEYYDTDGALQTATLGDFETRLCGDVVICKPKEDREWPAADTRLDAIKITYVAGFGDSASDVPMGIRHAIKMLVGNWYENREATTDLNLMAVPMAVEALIGAERTGWYG